MLAKSTVEEVKAYSDIVTIINEYVPLKRRGRNWIGLCPFHHEKTPSFTVSPDKQIFHCFGCHESGNLIGFVMKIENLAFFEAVEQIARKVGIEIKKEDNYVYSREEKELTQIKDVLYYSREYFKQLLQENSDAKNYFLDRGLDERTIKNFHLGYAPSTSIMLKFLQEKGFEQEIILKSGLFYINDQNEPIFRFRGRVMFPIIDSQGRTVGFGGRIFQETTANLAKYVNSEENPLFTKRRLLYAVSQAKSNIAEKKSAILMEGYMDVITAHQFGFTNTLGSMGTALTSEHIQLLKRLTTTVYLCFDTDNAGKEATRKSLDLLHDAGINAFVVNYGAKDPADFLHLKGADEFKLALQSAQSIFEYKFIELKEKFGIANIENKSRILDEIMPIVKKEKDIIVKKHYIYQLSRDLDLNQELILAKSQKIDNMIKSTPQFFSIKKKENKFKKAEKYIIYAISTNLELRHFCKEKLKKSDFVSEEYANLFEKIIQIEAIDKDIIEEQISTTEKQLLAKLLVEEEIQQSYIYNQIDDCIETLKVFLKEKRVKEIKNQVRELENLGNKEEEVSALLLEMNQLLQQ